MVEIGSEFQLYSSKSGINEYETLGLNSWESRYMLSGRTALAYVADELLSLRNNKKIALPAYSCVSMVYKFDSLSPLAAQMVKNLLAMQET